MEELAIGISLRDSMSSALLRIEEQVARLSNSLTKLGGEMDDVEDLNTNRSEKEVNELRGATDNATASAERLNGALGMISKMAKMFIFGALAKQAIDYASDLTEVQNVVDVTFGGMSNKVDDWAKGTLKAFGLNELSAKKFAGTMGAMLKSSGMTGDAVADMSMKITELAGDMASFYNLQGEEAFYKIKAGMSGETEPLKDLGIDMSVASLNAFALSKGLDKTFEKMSNVEKAQLRYEYLLQSTADAQGDFARTSDGFANQQKLMFENFNALLGNIASTVLPILAAGLMVVNNFIEKLNALFELAKAHWSTIEPFVMSAVVALTIYVAWLGLVALWTNGVTLATKLWRAAIDKLPFMWVITAITAIIGALQWWGNKMSETSGTTHTALGNIVGAFLWVCATIYNAFLKVLTTIIGWVWDIFVEPCMNMLEFWINLFMGGFDSIEDTFKALLNNLVNFLLGFVKLAAKLLDKLFNTDMTKGIENLQAKLNEKLEVKAKYEIPDEYKKNPTADLYQRYSLDADKAFEWGASGGDKLYKAMGFVEDAVDKNTNAINMASESADAIGMQTAKNTADKKVDISQENLVYLRDVAEREAINKYTTAEVKVDMTNNNNVSNGYDINTMIKQLASGVKEAMTVSAQGVF